MPQETIVVGKTLRVRLPVSTGTLGDVFLTFPSGSPVLGSVGENVIKNGVLFRVRLWAESQGLALGAYSLPMTYTLDNNPASTNLDLIVVPDQGYLPIYFIKVALSPSVLLSVSGDPVLVELSAMQGGAVVDLPLFSGDLAFVDTHRYSDSADSVPSSNEYVAGTWQVVSNPLLSTRYQLYVQSSGLALAPEHEYAVWVRLTQGAHVHQAQVGVLSVR